ncbi:MAG: 4a-hydroxytetrahydrobiopterin dehydratase [Nanoarchaeales archaeon]|nr:4a-hydroxytetrahydrobiopterin dehydratase [Nanoarchaeales archaeon]
MTKLLPQDQIDESMLMLNEWTLEDNDVGQLVKEIEFKTPSEAFKLIEKIGQVSEKIGQTPDILMHSNGKFVEIMITDYDYEGITQICIDLAFEIDGVL